MSTNKMSTNNRSSRFAVAVIHHCLLFALLALAPASARSQERQELNQVIVGPGPSGGIATGMVSMQERGELVKGRPYQADATTETIQTLADGSHITQKITAHVARDAEGRTMRSQALSGIGPWASANNKQITLVSIFDPVAGQHIDYSSDNKTAHILPTPNGNQIFTANTIGVFASGAPAGGMMIGAAPGPPPLPPGGASGSVIVTGGPILREQGATDSPSPTPAFNETSESLGTRTVEGVSAEGTRAKDTIPAGAIGNDKDLVSMRETWYSSDLKIVVSSLRSDPRFGEVHYSLTNIQLKEPDPALFQVPPGYTVERIPVRVESAP
jgi:hypothetical protein